MEAGKWGFDEILGFHGRLSFLSRKSIQGAIHKGRSVKIGLLVTFRRESGLDNKAYMMTIKIELQPFMNDSLLNPR